MRLLWWLRTRWLARQGAWGQVEAMLRAEAAAGPVRSRCDLCGQLIEIAADHAPGCDRWRVWR